MIAVALFYFTSTWADYRVQVDVDGIKMYVEINTTSKKAKVLNYYEGSDGFWCIESSIPINTTGHFSIPEKVTYADEKYTITNIGSYAFSNCTNLTGITIPSSVTSIGEKVFSGCTNLTNITVASGNTVYDSRENCNAIIGKERNVLIVGCKSTTFPSSVTGINSEAFYGCSGLTSIIIPEGVTYIGRNAFSECTSLTSINIPSTLTSIGESAFSGCTNLKKVIVQDISSWCRIAYDYIMNSTQTDYYNYDANPLYYAGHIYSNEDTEITNLVIPGDVNSIGRNAFGYCVGLKSVTIPSSVKRINDWAFAHCENLKSVTISEGVTYIGRNAFNASSDLTTTLPESLTTIGKYAFTGSVILPDDINFDWNYESFESSSFMSAKMAKQYVNKGSVTLLKLWSKCSDEYIYEIGTNNQLLEPSLEGETTQTTMKVKIENYYDGYDYTINGEAVKEVKEENLLPLTEKLYTLRVSKGETVYERERLFATRSLGLDIRTDKVTASSIAFDASYTHGDAVVTSEKLYFNGKLMDGYTVSKKGLVPNSSYAVKYDVTTGGKTYTYNRTIKTQALNMKTSLPKVISSGNVIVAAETNVDPEEENVGFEWRRTDWTDDFPSNTGIAYLYEGTMEGYIRNLNTDKLWKFRPYYLSDSGTYHYGDWMGLDPTNTSYFEPTVHTYAKIEVEGNTALVKGYALNGTDKIAVQGFKYWKSSNKANGMSMAPAKAPAIPGSAQTVEAEGRVMEATLSGLDYETDYSYVAFVKTTEGETFYGDVRSFTTGVNTSGIDTAATTDSSVEVVGIYNLQGHRQNALRPGINIVRYSDGTAKKVMIRR